MEVAEPQPRPISKEMMAYIKEHIKLYLFQELLQQIIAELERRQAAVQPAPAGNRDILERLVRLEEGLKVVIEQLQMLSQQMDKRFEQMDKRFDAFQTQLDRRFAEEREYMDKRFDTFQIQLDRRFAEQREDNNRRIAEEREDNNRRFAEQRDDTAKISKRVSAFGVVIIGLLSGAITLMGIILAN